MSLATWNSQRSAALLVRSAVAQVGLLDERYFLYYEDLDYCKRLRACDWRLRYAPNAHVWHTVSASSGGSLGSPFNFFWKAQSAGRYYRKHGRGWRMLLIAPYRLASAGRTSLQLLGKRRWRALRAYWVGLYYGWRYGNADTPPPAWVIQPEKLASQENL